MKILALNWYKFIKITTSIGTIHYRHQQFFTIFDPYPPPVGNIGILNSKMPIFPTLALLKVVFYVHHVERSRIWNKKKACCCNQNWNLSPNDWKKNADVGIPWTPTPPWHWQTSIIGTALPPYKMQTSFKNGWSHFQNYSKIYAHFGYSKSL